MYELYVKEKIEAALASVESRAVSTRRPKRDSAAAFKASTFVLVGSKKSILVPVLRIHPSTKP